MRQVLDQDRYKYRIVGNGGYAIKDNVTLEVSIGHGQSREVITFFDENSFVNNINNLRPTQAVAKYLTGYIIELSLSVDNLFVIANIFTSFKILMRYQHKLLFLVSLERLYFVQF